MINNLRHGKYRAFKILSNKFIFLTYIQYMLYYSCKELEMEISIQGVTKVNYELVIDEDVFNEACEEAGLDPANFKKFTKDDWDELNPHLVQAVVDNESDIDYTEIHVETSVFADTLTIDDSDNVTTVYYDKNRKADSVEIQ